MEKTKNKMVIVMRKELGMTKGKYVAQGSHASLGLVLELQKSENEIHREILEEWLSGSFVKVCLYVQSHQELLDLFELAKKKGLPTKLITDNGLTMFGGVPTDTCLSILGPRESIDEITGHLKLL